MKRAVRRALLLSALAAPSALYALGLGEIRLNSALNQPFDAEIELVSATSDDLAALTAALAPSDTFQRYGLDKQPFLSDFTFRVARSSGRDVLKITSPRPVTEPFVTLLVEASWPRGRLLREYTVLLDPPTMAPATVTAAPMATPPAAVIDSGPRTIAAPTVPESASRPRSSSDGSGSRAVTASARLAGVEPGGTYRVRPNDTLWHIASAANPGPRAEVNRTMVAIYQANPAAFGGNINVLRAGSELRIPTAGEASAISAAAAADEVARQYRLWTEGVIAGAPPSDAAGRLRLVTPEQGSAAPSIATAAPVAQPGPAPAEPTVAGPTSTVELQQRLERLEAELAEARRLLEVRNAELATLQGATASPTTDAGVEPAVPGGAVGAAPEAHPAEPQVAPEAAPVTEPVAEPEAAAAKKPKRAAAPRAPEEPSLFDRLRDYWWALLLPLLLALGAVFWSRRRREAQPAEDGLEEALAPRSTADFRVRHDPRRGESNIVVEERHAAEPTVAAAAAATANASRRATTVADTISGDGPVSIEAGDPLAEADFHMAYGLYDQAADLVQLALKREPQRRDLMLKLVEIFFVWGNRDRFLETARQMHATRGQAGAGEWDKVLIMGRQIAPEDALFADKSLSSAASLDLELQGGASTTDFELPAAGASSVDLELTSLAPEVRGEDSVDFLLDEPHRGGPDDGSLSPTVEAPRVRRSVDDPTAELEIEELGIDTRGFEGLDSTTSERRPGELEVTLEQPVSARGSLVEDTIQEDMSRRGSTYDDTVQQDMSRRGSAYEDTVEEDMTKRRSAFEDTVQQPIAGGGHEDAPDQDLLSATSMLKVDLTELGKQALDEVAAGGADVIDLSGPTGEMPSLDLSDLDDTGQVTQIELKGDGDITMSEVGTKLDLARAYIDMGDPEGARSILEEVLKEGNAGHKQEAERLMAGLP
jgi:pilus assembly protein FimV